MQTAVEPATDDAVLRAHARRVTLAVIASAYMLIAAALSLTKIPICDEGLYADPALHLIRHGNMGSPVLESAGTFLTGIDQKTYWIMPVHILVQAAWDRIFGPSLFSARMLSAVAGLAALLCFYIVVRRITSRERLALFVMGLIAVDTSFLVLAGTGRSDMLSLAFGAAAQASYLTLRASKLTTAVLVAHAFVAASGLTHPIGGLAAFASLVCLQFYFDGARRIAIAAIPYAAGAAAWGLYIARAPQFFLAQFGGNSGERLWPWKLPLLAVRREVVERYIGGYTMGSAWSRLADVRLLILAAYLTAVIAVLATPRLRRNPLAKVALVQAGLIAMILLLFEGAKQPWYLIYLVFPLAALLALAVPRRSAWTAAMAAFIGLQLAYPAMVIVQDKYRKTYMPLIEHVAPGTFTMGTAELGFGLGFENVLDDPRLGFYTGQTPDNIVLDPRYESYIKDAPQPVRTYIADFLNRQYRLAFSNSYYTLYTRQRPGE